MQSQKSQKIRGVVNFQQEISNCIFLPGGTHLLIPLVKLVSHGGNDGKWNGAPTGHHQQCSQPCQQCSQPAQRCSQPGGVLRVGLRMEMKRFGGGKRRFPMNMPNRNMEKMNFATNWSRHTVKIVKRGDVNLWWKGDLSVGNLMVFHKIGLFAPNPPKFHVQKMFVKRLGSKSGFPNSKTQDNFAKIESRNVTSFLTKTFEMHAFFFWCVLVW